MPRSRKNILEYRTYSLPADFPMYVLDGEEWHISPIPSNRLHIHNCLEIGLCHSDSGQMILGEEQVPFFSGYVTCIARNVPHTTWSSPGESSRWSYLYVDMEALLSRYGLALLPDMGAFYQMLSTCRFMLPPEQYPWARPLAQELLTEFQQKDMGYKTSIRGLLLSFAIRLLRVYSAEKRDSDAVKNLTALSPALEYMHAHYDQNFSMEALAEMCHISSTHFRRMFHAQMGTSPLHFLHQLRVIHSCALLRTTDLTVAEVATRVGYSSLSSYNLFFRRIMGSTPTRWRKSGEERPALISYTGWLRAETPEEERME